MPKQENTRSNRYREEEALLIENREWDEFLDDVLAREGPERVTELVERMHYHARYHGVKMPFTANTPYINTIPANEQPPFGGNREIERRIKSIVRWNAMAMVVRANRMEEGSADIFRHTLRPPLCGKLRSIISSVGRKMSPAETRCTFKDTPRPAFTREPFWKGG